MDLNFTTVVDDGSSYNSSLRKADHRKRFMISLLRQVFDWFKPRLQLRRYRVAPREHPILFRRRLMQGIARELRSAGLVVSRKPVQYSDTAL
jgi:hypothetical protein